MALLIIIGVSCKINTDKYCVRAKSGEEALDIISKNLKENNFLHCDFELILMDHIMPTLDGYQTATKIRTMMHYEKVPQVIIICVSGNSD